jgi:hypothetical protein
MKPRFKNAAVPPHKHHSITSKENKKNKMLSADSYRKSFNSEFIKAVKADPQCCYECKAC